MREYDIIAMLSPEALRALAHYYKGTAEILLRRADKFDPPKPVGPHPGKQIFLQIPDFVAELQQAGHSLESAIALVMVKTASTRARVEQALKYRRKQDRAALTDLRLQQSRAMLAAGIDAREIAKALGCTERHVRRLAAGHGLIGPEGHACD